MQKDNKTNLEKVDLYLELAYELSRDENVQAFRLKTGLQWKSN